MCFSNTAHPFCASQTGIPGNPMLFKVQVYGLFSQTSSLGVQITKSTREKNSKHINIIQQFITRYSQTQIQTNTIGGLLPCQQISIYDQLVVKSFCVFYPHNTRCQFNMLCHWLYTDPPQFKWKDWNRKWFIYPYGYQNYKYQFTHGSPHDTQWNICAYYYIYLINK